MIQLQHVTHRYLTGTSTEPVLCDVSLSIQAGHTCAIVGTSGSGKSTLLNLIGLLDVPYAGQIILGGKDMTGIDSDVRAMIRNQTIGFVFQSFNLLPRLDAIDNVALPLLYRGVPRQRARHFAQLQLQQVGLADRGHHRPADLSGGQRQRVAIARALIGSPSLLLADEPTGNLDPQTAQDILALLLSLNQKLGTTLVIVTHDASIAKQMTRCITVYSGRIHEA